MTPMEIFVYAAPALVLLLALTYSRYAGRRLDRMQAELDQRSTRPDIAEEDDVFVFGEGNVVISSAGNWQVRRSASSSEFLTQRPAKRQSSETKPSKEAS